MFGAPLIVGARVTLVVGLALQLLGASLLANALASAFVIAAFLVEALGFLDLSYRTRGGARTVAQVVAASPLAVIAVIAAVASTDKQAISTVFAWCYGLEVYGAVAALWLATRRHLSIALATIAVDTLSSIVPRFHLGIVNAILARTGVAGVGLLVFGPMILTAVLAFLAGRDLPPTQVPIDRIGRTLLRTLFAMLLLVVVAVAKLATGRINELAWLACIGYFMLAIAAYRTRTRSPAAFAPCIAAFVAMTLVAIGGSMQFANIELDAMPFLMNAVGLIAVAAFVAVQAQRKHAIAVGALCAVALAADAIGILGAAFACELALDLVAAFALVRAGRTLATTPEPTVAEVFA
jgi:hypothetical protein